MRHITVVLALAVGVGASCSTGGAALEPLPPGGHRVLFIGNSLTYVNDLPRTLSNLAASVGDTIKTMMVAEPDYNLEDHVASGRAPKAIALGGWEYVVLQQGPSSLEENRQNLILMTQYYDAGLAWQAAWEADSTLALYGGDGFHPSALGTYLAAAVMYERITGKDARALPKAIVVEGRSVGATEAVAKILQDAAHRANIEFPLRARGR